MTNESDDRFLCANCNGEAHMNHFNASGFEPHKYNDKRFCSSLCYAEYLEELNGELLSFLMQAENMLVASGGITENAPFHIRMKKAIAKAEGGK